MFTGLVEAVGVVLQITPESDGLVIWIDLSGLDCESISLGDSIAINGACLTVTEMDGSVSRFDVSSETLSKCLIGKWRVGDRVNLEQALTLGKPLGGHLVSGHVDGTGVLEQLRPSDDSTWMQFSAPRSIGRYIAAKGSVAVDGVSLTSNHVEDHFENQGQTTVFDLTLVPHTLKMTTLGALAVGSAVHLEVDMLARYLDRMQQSDRDAANQ